MKDRSDDGCSVLGGGALLLLFFWVLTRIVAVFNPGFLANNWLCCAGASLLLVFMFMFDQDALKEADVTLRRVFILLLIAVGLWILAAPAKTLSDQISAWLRLHPNVMLTVFGTICLGPLALALLLSRLSGPSTHPYARRERYHPEDSDGYYDS